MTIPTATTSIPTPTAVRVVKILLQVMIIGSFIISGAHGWLVESSSSLLSSSFSPSWHHVQAATATTRCTTRSLTRSRMTSEADAVDVSKTDDTEAPPFATIIGNGRIGNALSKAGNCLVLGRKDHIDPKGHGPIFIATRNDSLDSIIDGCPITRRQDLVFLQNGYLESYLESKGLLVDDKTTPTQVLLYLSVAALGLPPTDGITTYNPEGLTLAYGRHADNFARRLSALQLKCTVCTNYDTEYTPAMYEKLIWISTYMLVGTANGCGSVGEAQQHHQEQIETIITELVTAVSAKENIIFPEGTIPRLASYTEVVADFPCGVKEFEWRNQYFWNLGDDLVPIHNQLLKDCATKGLLAFALPSSSSK